MHKTHTHTLKTPGSPYEFSHDIRCCFPHWSLMPLHPHSFQIFFSQSCMLYKHSWWISICFHGQKVQRVEHFLGGWIHHHAFSLSEMVLCWEHYANKDRMEKALFNILMVSGSPDLLMRLYCITNSVYTVFFLYEAALWAEPSCRRPVWTVCACFHLSAGSAAGEEASLTTSASWPLQGFVVTVQVTGELDLNWQLVANC